MAGGGAERVLLNVLKYIDRERFSPSLALFKKEGELMGEVPPDVEVHGLGMSGVRLGREALKLLLNLRRLMKTLRPDVVLSFMWESNMLNAASNVFSGRKTVVSEHIALLRYFEAVFGHGAKRRLTFFLTRLIYPRASLAVSVSGGLMKDLAAVGITGERVRVIHNPVDLKVINSLKEDAVEVGGPFVLFAGRLTKQKNVPLLVEAFGMIKDRHPAKLLILGQGEEEEALRNMCKDLGIKDRVVFKGFVQNPFKYMRKAEVFVLPSDFEGFGCVLVEAMATGTPVISTDCPYGPNEIIEDGKDGLLVPVGDPEAMARAMERLLTDRSLRERLVEGGLRKAGEFEVQKVVRRYEMVIDYVTGKTEGTGI